MNQNEISGELMTSLNKMEEKTEKVLINFLLEDKQFQRFLRENYIFLEMNNLETDSNIELQRIIYPMRKEEFEKLKKMNGLEKVQELMKKKLEEMSDFK